MGVVPYGEIAPSNPIDGNFEDAMHILKTQTYLNTTLYSNNTK